MSNPSDNLGPEGAANPTSLISHRYPPNHSCIQYQNIFLSAPFGINGFVRPEERSGDLLPTQADIDALSNMSDLSRRPNLITIPLLPAPAPLPFHCGCSLALGSIPTLTLG